VATMNRSERWYNDDYLRIVGASYKDGYLSVRFADGSDVALAVAHIRPDAVSASWDQLTFDNQEVTVPGANGLIEIPWSTIRTLTDDAYNAHLARKAEEQSRRIGVRLRELREGSHLTGAEAASRAGLTTEGLSRIEQGQDKAAFQALDRLLKAMGYSWRDLSADTLAVEEQFTR